METLNLYFGNNENILISICWILSYLSWLLLTINSWVSFGWLYREKFRSIWIIKVIIDYENYISIPLQMFYIMIYVVFNLSNVIILFGCIFFFIKTLFKKDDEMIIQLMNNLNKYHFFPLLCGFIMFLLGECSTDNNKDFKAINITGLVISFLGLSTMIFIYINTNFNCNDWMSNFFIKKGVYSCLIILFWYNFCYSIYFVHIADKLNDNEYDASNWIRGCGLFFSIFFGLCTLIFSFFFKDILICFFNFLIYIGLAIYFYICDVDKILNSGIGIVDMIIISLSFILLIFLIMFNYINNFSETKTDIQNLQKDKNKMTVKVKNNSEQIKLIISYINITPVDPNDESISEKT